MYGCVVHACYTRVAFVHGGQHYVIGFTHFATGVKKSYRISRKSDVLPAIQRALVWFNVHLAKRGLRVTSECQE